MNRQDNPVADLYERLNRGHDGMRESLLARLPSAVEDKRQHLEDAERRTSDHRQSFTGHREIWNHSC